MYLSSANYIITDNEHIILVILNTTLKPLNLCCEQRYSNNFTVSVAWLNLSEGG